MGQDSVADDHKGAKGHGGLKGTGISDALDGRSRGGLGDDCAGCMCVCGSGLQQALVRAVIRQVKAKVVWIFRAKVTIMH